MDRWNSFNSVWGLKSTFTRYWPWDKLLVLQQKMNRVIDPVDLNLTNWEAWSYRKGGATKPDYMDDFAKCHTLKCQIFKLFKLKEWKQNWGKSDNPAKFQNKALPWARSDSLHYVKLWRLCKQFTKRSRGTTGLVITGSMTDACKLQFVKRQSSHLLHITTSQLLKLYERDFN